MTWPAYPAYKEAGIDWLDSIPATWEVTKLAWCTTCSSGEFLPNDQVSRVADGQFNVPVIGGNGIMGFTDVSNTKADAIAIGRVGALCGNVHQVSAPAWITDNALRIGIRSGLDANYLRLVLQSRNLNELATKTAQPLITGTQVSSQRMPAPELSEQRRIVQFLDRETAKIDSLIAKQEQLVATLREGRDSAWSQLLDEVSCDASSVKLRWAIDSIVDGPFGSSLTSAHYVEDGARVIRLGNIGVNEFKDSDRAYISLAYAGQLSAHSVMTGDVVIAGLGDERMPLGRAVVVPEIGPAIVKADCFRVRPKKGLTPEFLAWSLSAPQTRSQMALLSRGATRARLNTSVVGEVTIPLPSIDRQRKIIEQSRRRLAEIDALVDKSVAVIEILREYRSALITDAVTGKIDVRGAA